MYKLSKDEIFSIAINLDIPELLSFCESNKKINQIICKKDEIWYKKLNKDFPNWENFNINQSKKDIYKKIYELKILKKKLNLKYDILELYNLDYLDLYGKNIISLPKEIGALSNLEIFYLVKTGLSELPKEIGKLQKLKELDLRNNNLIELPKEIEKLQKLEGLALSGNKIKKWPQEIEKLQNLQTLDIDKNESFFKEIRKLKLEELFLNDQYYKFQDFLDEY